MNIEEKNVWWIVVEDGELVLHDSKGNRVFGQIFTRVHEAVGEVTTALVKFVVNVGTREEMIAFQNSNK